MKTLEQVIRALFPLLSIATVLTNCQNSVVNNGTKVVDLHDPGVDATVKSALENGTVSEVVVRKDLLLFPINAPNLVIAHRQEIHAVPQNNGTESTDGKPTAAEVAEVNEYSLSQVVSNDTDDNEAESPYKPTPASAPLRGPENDAILEPGKLLEVPSGFNLSDGLATEKVALPNEVQNLSVPKQSIVDLLSKSLSQASATLTTEASSRFHKLLKRSLDSDDYSRSDESTSSTSTLPTLVDFSAMVKRSVAPQEDDEDDSESDDSSSSTSTTENVDGSTEEVDKRSVDADASSTTEDSSAMEVVKRSVDTSGPTTESSSEESSSSNIVKRSIDLDDDDDDDDDSASTTEFYDHEVSSGSGSNSQNQRFTSADSNFNKNDDDTFNEIGDKRQYIREKDTDEDMDVAEDIVFRPLFRYRQETRLRQQYSPYRRSGNRYYGNSHGDRYRYENDNSDYD